jgi:GT2 family glycosyltransferase
LNSDGSVQTSCIQSIPTILNQLLDSEALRRRWPKLPLWGMRPLYEYTGKPAEVEGVSGACLMVARRTFERVGGFSEDYFMYAEDLDLAFKVREAGYRNYYVPDATVIHYGGSSSEQASSTFSAVMLPEAIWRFLRKTRGDLYGLGYRAAMCASALARLTILWLTRWFAPQRGYRAVDGSVAKWVAVLRWSLKRDDLVKRYYPQGQQPSYGR